jgi:hypothetical protein
MSTDRPPARRPRSRLLDANWMTRRALNGAALTLIVIFGLGLAVLAVVHVRNRANMMRCQDNLRWAAIALSGHNDTYGVLPLAVSPVLPPGEKYSVRFPQGGPLMGLPVERRFSWQVETLPFLMSQHIFSQLDFTKAWDDPENVERLVWQETWVWDEGTHSQHPGPIKPVVMSMYQCPAAAHVDTPGTPTVTNYIGIAGVGTNAAYLPQGDRQAGVFGYDRQIGIRDVKDPRTLMLIETGVANGPWAAGGFATTRGLDPAQPYLGADGQFDTGHPVPAQFSRQHVTHAVFVDGSCRALSEMMDATIFEALATVVGRKDGPPEF